MATATWNTTAGDWFSAANWDEPNPLPPPSTLHYVPGAADDATFGGTGPYTVTYNGIDAVQSLNGAQLVTLVIGGGSLTIGAGGGDLASLSTVANSTFALADGAFFNIVGATDNAGTITLGAAGDTTKLTFGLQTTQSPVSLTGGGKITMSDSANNNIFIDNSASLDNVDNTISGGGSITSNFQSFTNEAQGVIDATGTLSGLTVDLPTFTNAGLLEATGTGGLQLEGDTHAASMTIENAGGTIAAIGAGTHVDLSNGTTIAGGTLTTSGGGVIQVTAGTCTLDGTGTNSPVTIATGSNVKLDDGTGLILTGAAPNDGVYVNHGTIALNSTGDLTRLTIGGQTNSSPVSLQGGGAVTLSDNAGNNIFIQNSATLDNVDNTISGAGSISANFTSLTNEAKGVIDATGTNALVLDLPTFINKGLLEDTGTGGLQISDPNGITVVNVGGTISATAAGAHVDLDGATIQGGLLGGMFRLTGNNTLDGTGGNAPVTIAAGSTLQLADNAGLTLAGGTATSPGVIVNHGTMTLNSTGDQTRLAVTAGGTVSLQGGGNVTLSDDAGNNIFDIQGALLDNVDNTISGAGSFGGLTNEASGIVDATGTMNGLLASFTTITNKGLLEDTGTAGLQIDSDTVVNVGGTISATGSGTHVDLNGTTIQGGMLGGLFQVTGSNTLDGTGGNAPVTIAAGSTIQLADNANLTLAGGSATNPGVIVNHGTITLNSTGDNTRLAVTAGDTVSLQGGGKVTLSDAANNQIFNIQGALLDNVDNTISGAGSFGGLTNEAAGIVDATGTMNGLSASFTTIINKGLLEDTGTAGMQLSNDSVVNAGGTISATGARTHVDLNGSTIEGGTLTTAAGGVLDVVTNTVQLDGSTAGAVTVSGAVSGTGTLALTAGETRFVSGATLATPNLSVAGGATADVAESLTYAGALANNGTVTLEGANTLELGGTVSGNGTVGFASGSDATLQLDATAVPNGQTFANTVKAFAPGDVIDLRGLAFQGNATPMYNSTTGALTVTEGTVTDTLTLAMPGAMGFVAKSDGAGGTEIVVCFAAGTRIRTPTGDVAVEQLAAGDLVVTASGAHRSIRWLGHREIVCRGHRDRAAVLPVRIAAHAFGEGRPARDLLVSPGHSLCVDVLGEMLVPASALLNGTTIAQLGVARIVYWHVELDSHDILLAENLPAESYLEMGNRAFFSEDDVVALNGAPDAPARTHADFCRPYAGDGPLVAAVRTRLTKRAQALATAGEAAMGAA